MVIKGVKEKFNELQEMGFNTNNSEFILCDCTRDYEEKFKVKNIIPLDNGITKIVIDRENLLITDLNGNVLLIFGDWEVDHNIIEYVNNKDLLISGYIRTNPSNLDEKEYVLLEHYHLDKDFKNTKTLYDFCDGELKNFEIINDDTVLISKERDGILSSRLYSLSKKNYLTPTLSKIEQINDKLFKFTDIIRSSIETENKRFDTSVIGFINIDGKFYNGVYDELSNREIECELNSKPDFEEYNTLREMIKGKLDEKASKELNKEMTRNCIVKKIENRAKNNL